MIVVLALPWLVPFAVGPSPAVVPWLVSALCAAVLLAQWWQIRWHDIAFAWLLAAVLSAWAGLVQYFGLSAHFAPWVNYAEPGTAFANLRQRNQFASLTSIGLLALWCLASMRWRPDARPGLRQSALALACAVLLGTANAISASRTGLVQWLLLGPVMYLLSRGRPGLAALPVAAWLGYAGASWLLPLLAGVDPQSHGIFSRFGDDAACASRLVLWRNVVDLILLRPWTGWGWGELDYAHYATLYEGPRFCDILDNAHNLPLHLAVELGAPAALLILGGIVWWVLRQRPWREKRPVQLMAWLVLAVIGLHSMLEYPLWYGPFQLAVALCVALLAGDHWRATAGAQLGARIVAGLLAAACLYAAWDYRRISQIYLAPEQRAAAYRHDTLAKIRDSLLFRRQVQFAWLTTTPLDRSNAQAVHAVALGLLHYSPEPRVVEKLIESAVLLGRDDEAQFHIARYRAAFPQAHAKWLGSR